MGILLTSLAFLVASVSSTAEETRSLPLSQVKPGMEGYGVTVFNGTNRERFTFRVRSIVPNLRGWPNVIVGELTGCSDCSEGGRHMFEHHQILGGMSGSPLDVVDSSGTAYTIGGLAMAKDFATTAKVLITPWEYQEGMASKLPDNPAGPTVAEPGDYSSTCLLYGDRDWCFDGTVTGRKRGYLFLMSHSLPWTSEEDFKFGEIALPVFRSPVADLLQSDQSATKLAGDRLEPLGSAVIHGKFGFVVREGELPTTMPVYLAINGVAAQPVTLEFHLAYDVHAPWALHTTLLEIINQLPETPSNKTDITVQLDSPKATFKLHDTAGAALKSLRSFLEYSIIQEKKNLRVSRIDIAYAPSQNDELWRPFGVQTSGKGERATARLLARRMKDNEVAQLTEVLDCSPLGIRVDKKTKLIWWDGASAQSVILDRMPVRDALAKGLLAQIEERESLYLLYAPGDAGLKVDKKKDGPDWVKRDSEVRLLLRPVFGHHRFYIPPSDDQKVHGIENETK